MAPTSISIWKPIQDLPEDWQSMQRDHLHALAQIWSEQQQRLRDSLVYRVFLEKLRRKIAIETGILERLYNIDTGITQLLIEQGIDEALIPHDSTDKPVSEVVALIRDQELAIDGLFDFVKGHRSLSTSYIKQLHQTLTKHQEDSEAIDQFGHTMRVQLLRGEWKKYPNNPVRPDGTIYLY